MSQCAQKTEPPLYDEARRHVAALKNAGLKREELIAVIDEIYGEGEKA